MSEYPGSIETLIEQFRKLPSIGRKTAQRLALSVVEMPPAKIEAFQRALQDVKEKIHHCPECGNLTDLELCAICANPKRDRRTLCVVEDTTNLLAIERGGTYRGLYHVLNGLISPMHDRGPDAIGIDDLMQRIQRSQDTKEPIQEVILAISPTVEGETTMLFVAEMIKRFGLKTTRIASGIPVGGSLEFYDELTLSKALEDRRSMEE